ncbi:hypothetical protein HN873_005858, partial [Arachis hypogaea]
REMPSPSPSPFLPNHISESNNNELLPATLASTTALCLYCRHDVRRTDPCSLSDSPVAGTLFLPRASDVFVFSPKTLPHSNLLPSSLESRSSTKKKTLLHSNLVAVCRSERLLLSPPLHSRTSVFVLSVFATSLHFNLVLACSSCFFYCLFRNQTLFVLVLRWVEALKYFWVFEKVKKM